MVSPLCCLRRDTLRAYRAYRACRVCANFLYGFTAARRAARAANSARSPLLPLALPQRRRLAPVGWREKHKPLGPLRHTAVTRVQLADWLAGAGSYREQVCSRTRYCPARPEPVKSAYGVGSADLRLLTEPARLSSCQQLYSPGTQVGSIIMKCHGGLAETLALGQCCTCRLTTIPACFAHDRLPNGLLCRHCRRAFPQGR